MSEDSPNTPKPRKHRLKHTLDALPELNYHLKKAISVDSKDLSVYITRNTAGEITDHLVLSKKKTVEQKFRRGMTFSQTKNQPIR